MKNAEAIEKMNRVDTLIVDKTGTITQGTHPLGYNTLGIPIAAGILFPFFGILLSPMIAALAMSFSSVSVIGNALRLRNVRI